MTARNGLLALAVLALTVLGAITWYQFFRPVAAAAVVPETVGRPATIICGKYAAPPLMVGTPISMSDTTISFDDGYQLRLKETPSLFIGKRGLFEIKDGIVVNYGLVADRYNPCPK